MNGDEMVEKARDRFDGVAVRIYKDGCFYGKSAEVPKWAEWIREQARSSVRDAVREFYNEVCQLAEENMLKTGKLEGAHFAAMQTVRKKFEVEG